MADLLSMKIPCGQFHVICFTFEFQWPEKVYCINSLVLFHDTHLKTALTDVMLVVGFLIGFLIGFFL